MTHKVVEPGDDAHAAERVVDLITRYAVRFDPVDRITFYSGIVRGLAPIRADLAAQMRADGIPKD
jgi:acetate kinase